MQEASNAGVSLFSGSFLSTFRSVQAAGISERVPSGSTNVSCSSPPR